MEKKILPLLFIVFFSASLQAQTWDGSAGTNWNDANNWTPAVVPGAASTVTIPATANQPVFANNVVLTGFNMDAGSTLDFNGFTLTTSGGFDINGGTLNNSNGATDITITISGTGSKYIRLSTINDHIIINYNGSSGGFYEAYQNPNTFNGNATFNIGGAAEFITCYTHVSTFNGNVTVNRTVAGATEIFRNGAVAVTGNFSYTNNIGGATAINDLGLTLTTISGTVNITATGAGNPTFSLERIKNNTTGGTISVQNSGNVTIAYDTLLLSAFNVNGYTGGSTDDFLQNQITGTVNISDVASNTGFNYFRRNTINGNTTITVNSAGGFYEGYQFPNTFNGDVTFNYTGTGLLSISHDNSSSYNGNVTINRSGSGTSEIFRSGAIAVTGNFSYTNNQGGATLINDLGTTVTPVSGTINISAAGAGNPSFLMQKVKNLTGGGTISVQNSGLVTIDNDTLLLAALNVNGYTSSGIDDISDNIITGTVNISDGPTNTASHYFRRNIVNGNTTFTCTSAASFYEAYQGGNTFNGDVACNFSGTAAEYICYQNASAFNGNLSVTRTVAGPTYILDNGFTALTGNFSYTNTVGGASFINDNAIQSATIGGTVNITASGPGNPAFTMKKIKNATTGGTISVQNSGQVSIFNDTLLLNAMNVNGFTGASVDDFNSLVITGTVNISDVPGNAGSIYIRRSVLNGNITYTQNSAAALFEAYQGANVYNGNVTLIRNAGTINFAYDNPTTVNQNLTINSSSGIVFTDTVKFNGASNSIIEQLGTQPINMPKLYVAKTGGASITLNDSVTITTKANFISGNVYTSAVNNLIFTDGSTNGDASATSHVIGPVTKIGNDIFTFPVGGPVSYNPIGMSAPVGVTSRFMAEYKNQNPSFDGYNTNSKAGSFGAALISSAGYWDVQRVTGVTNVTLTLGFNTNPYQQYPVLANLKVAHWNGAQWDDHGNGGTTGTSASGTVVNSVPITSFSPFALAGITNTYFYAYGNPGPGPDGTPVKIKGTGGWPSYQTRQLPAGVYSADSIYLVPNAASASFKLKDFYNVEKDDTTVTAPAAPVAYISANGNGTKNFSGWRHFVYMTNGSNEIIGAIDDNDQTLGNTTMTAYFSTANVATAPNGNLYLKRSFKITSQFAPAGTKRIRLYISKTEFNNLVAADPSSFPNGINSLTITKYTGPQEDSLFNPLPAGNSVIIPNSAITITDLGTMYSLDTDVTGFSGFYIGGNQSNVALCGGSSISIPSNISGATYQWQVDNGGGYVNLSNGGIYSGVSSPSLTLTNAPSTMYGYKYRCVVNGGTFSQIYTVKFAATWEGTASNAWENPANWSCGVLPDANTDVILNAGKPNFPQINSNVTIRTFRMNPGSSAAVNAGFQLTILK